MSGEHEPKPAADRAEATELSADAEELLIRRAQGGRRGLARWLGVVVGVALVAAAAVAVGRSGDALGGALTALRGAPWWMIALLLGLQALTLFASGLVFWVLTARYARVPLVEMIALVASSALLNYLPLRPGVLGRLAYHKAVHGIRVSDGVRPLIWAAVLSVLGALGLVALVGACALFVPGDHPLMVGAPLVAVAGVGSLAAYARRARPSPDPEVWRLPAAMAIRLIELHLWAARYAVAFALIGAPIAWGAALALACITTLATMIPISGNGLGVREWAVGLAAPALPIDLRSTTLVTRAGGLAADLVNRAAEIAVTVPAGLIACAWLARRVRYATTPAK